jgi:hypothetical protein
MRFDKATSEIDPRPLSTDYDASYANSQAQIQTLPQTHVGATTPKAVVRCGIFQARNLPSRDAASRLLERHCTKWEYRFRRSRRVDCSGQTNA